MSGDGRQGRYGYSVQVLKFRLEQYDQSGNRTKMMDVEMRGLSIPGRIVDGGWVEVFGRAEDGLIHAKQIAKKRGMRWKRINATAVVVLRVQQINSDWEATVALLPSTR